MYKQYELPFASDALEPTIDALTVGNTSRQASRRIYKGFQRTCTKGGYVGYVCRGIACKP